MAKVRLVGVQAAVKQFGEPIPVGDLVAGVWQGRPVLALAAHDDSGQFFIALNGGPGEFAFVRDTELSHLQKVEGDLIIEPTEGVVPFALPHAEAKGSALVLMPDGDVGLRITMDEPGGQSWVTMNSLKTGNPITGSGRILLRGFKLLLRVDGRDKPMLIGVY